MPSASLELQQEWEQEAIARRGQPGHEPGHGDLPERAAVAYLEEQGYTEPRNGWLRKPSPDHNPTKKEWSAIYYLIYEWDFGGLVGPEPNPEGVDPL